GRHARRHGRAPAGDRAGERHGACGALHPGISRSATAVTLETVIFDRPGRVTFRLVRGPVPHVTEEFALTEHNGVTTLAYSGELGIDFGIAGWWWAGRVATAWQGAVRASFASIRAEAERRASHGAPIP